VAEGDAWLTSHPAPVAAPCAGCAELQKNYDACHRQHEATKKKLLEALRRLGDSGDYISFRARITEAAR